MPSLYWVVLCLVAAVVPAIASNAGRVVIRDNVTPTKKDELVQKLRAISGLPTLDFDREGILRLGSGSKKSGSQSARELLAQAVSGDKLIVIEDASSRADVAFCRVVPARVRAQGGPNLHAYVVLIDFADFRQLLGDDEARAAFDVGWGFLHEIEHVVADSKDPDEQGLLGECESHVNLMRSEVGLPLRVEYFFTVSLLKTDPNFGTKLVRLAFERYDVRKARTRRYWLMWDSVAVGGLITNSQTAVTRSISSK